MQKNGLAQGSPFSLMADVVAEQRAPCGCDAEQVAGPVNVDSPESKSTI